MKERYSARIINPIKIGLGCNIGDELVGPLDYEQSALGEKHHLIECLKKEYGPTYQRRKRPLFTFQPKGEWFIPTLIGLDSVKVEDCLSEKVSDALKRFVDTTYRTIYIYQTLPGFIELALQAIEGEKDLTSDEKVKVLEDIQRFFCDETQVPIALHALMASDPIHFVEEGYKEHYERQDITGAENNKDRTYCLESISNGTMSKNYFRSEKTKIVGNLTPAQELFLREQYTRGPNPGEVIIGNFTLADILTNIRKENTDAKIVI